MPPAYSAAGTSVPEALSTSSIAPGPSATLRGSSGSENAIRIVELSSSAPGAPGAVGAAPLIATTAGGAARGRVLRVVKRTRGPLAGRFFAVGESAARAYTPYAVPSARSSPASCTIRPSPSTSAVAAIGPSGPTTHSEPTGSAAVPVHAAIALATTGSENVSTTRALSGTSSCPSRGNV